MIFKALPFLRIIFEPYFLYEEVIPVRLYVNLNIFFLIVNINGSINNFSFKYICVVC